MQVTPSPVRVLGLALAALALGACGGPVLPAHTSGQPLSGGAGQWDPAQVGVSPPSETTLSGPIDVVFQIWDPHDHDAVLQRLVGAVQVLGPDGKPAHATTTVIPGDRTTGYPNDAADRLRISPSDGPGWYTVVIWKVEVPGTIGVDWGNQGTWHDAGDHVYANYAFQTSSPGLQMITADKPAQDPNSHIGLTWSEAVVLPSDLASVASFFDKQKQLIGCGPATPSDYVQCPVPLDDIAYIRIDTPPATSSGTAAVFPVPHQITPITKWLIVSANNVREWMPDRRGPPAGASPPEPLSLAGGSQAGSSCSVAGPANGLMPIALLIALLALRRRRRTSPRRRTRFRRRP